MGQGLTVPAVFGTVAASLCIFMVPKVASQPVSKEALDSCRSYSNVAAAIMEERQEGTPMPDLMDALSSIEEQPELAQTMVRLAYEEPMYRAPEHKQRAISKFRDDTYKRCFDSLEAKEKGR